MIKPTILLSPRKSAIPAQVGVLEVLVRVQAPDQSSKSQGKKVRSTWRWWSTARAAWMVSPFRSHSAVFFSLPIPLHRRIR